MDAFQRQLVVKAARKHPSVKESGSFDNLPHVSSQNYCPPETKYLRRHNFSAFAPHLSVYEAKVENIPVKKHHVNFAKLA